MAVEKIFPMAEYFVVITGANKRHIQTLADEISKVLKGEKLYTMSLEGYDQGWWVLLDYGVVIVHIFANDAREYYDLENLWGDAQPVEWEELRTRWTGS